MINYLRLLIHALRKTEAGGIARHVARRKSPRDKTPGKDDDQMAGAPYYAIYFPEKDGLLLKIEEKDLYFCRKKCRERFIESRINSF